MSWTSYEFTPDPNAPQLPAGPAMLALRDQIQANKGAGLLLAAVKEIAEACEGPGCVNTLWLQAHCRDVLEKVAAL